MPKGSLEPEMYSGLISHLPWKLGLHGRQQELKRRVAMRRKIRAVEVRNIDVRQCRRRVQPMQRVPHKVSDRTRTDAPRR
ncbi:hypothetical protein BLA23254_04465 [Burkholderia lata]|uniref:Uncharacterized protein n=1 Tax=Burkholderia lata (strain ATCC 17760 / DSM 23089 / LMG 22485 / NCIMB 9086 / R18194 / 383) TaxID=482957 RepID=A0A6P2NCS0_BURL3|nr:hypothetical protein BLA23254_04465 [Burkholderia lata]